MATNLATLTTTAPRTPGKRPFLMPSILRERLRVASKATTSVPAHSPLVDLQNPLNRFIAGKSHREYLGGESVFSQGDLANAVFYIQAGRVKLTVVSTSGKEAVIAHLAAGSFFGEDSLAGEQLRMSSAQALVPSSIIRIDKTAMQNLLCNQQKFAEGFRAYLLSRNMRMQADLVDHLFNSSEKRLARLLMLMANFGQESKPVPVIAKISQETLADMIGTTRSRVSFFLNRFRNLGHIDYSRDGMLINSSLVDIVLHD